ncbi:hypothetical protein JYT25_00630 [bacterium AH-315-C20]|nr:hypothetical protein [bacterium AH-315-C20]
MQTDPTEVLEQNFKWFLDHKEELNVQYPNGGHIVVCDCEPKGVWDSRNKALAEGIKMFGNVPFLVRSLRDEDAHQVNFSIKSTI